uniref:protein S100-A1-like isoform X1 n=2 Tax=Pristiophorus japonicus TaxID=55135 RepID=UPI00398F53FB
MKSLWMLTIFALASCWINCYATKDSTPSFTMTTPTRTEVAMQNLMDVFYEYTEGDKYTLTKSQMKTLVETELNQLTKNKTNVEAFDKMMKDLDFDGDGEVNFEEFVSFIAGLMYTCNAIYVQRRQKQAKAGGVCQTKK